MEDYRPLKEIIAFDYHDGPTVGIGRRICSEGGPTSKMVDWDDAQDVRIFEMRFVALEVGRVEEMIREMPLPSGSMRFATADFARSIEENLETAPVWLLIGCHPDSVDAEVRDVPDPRPVHWFEELGLDRAKSVD